MKTDAACVTHGGVNPKSAPVGKSIDHAKAGGATPWG